MPTLINDVDLPVVATDLSLSEAQRREQLHQLAHDHWIAKTDLGYVITTHDDCAAMLRDRRWFSALALIAQTQNYESEEWSSRPQRPSILSTEGDDHQRIRRIVSPSFTPKSADRLRPFMRDVVNELLDPICEAGHSEFVADVLSLIHI